VKKKPIIDPNVVKSCQDLIYLVQHKILQGGMHAIKRSIRI